MKTLFSVSSLVVFLSSSAGHRNKVFDKYLPIATLFDSPVFLELWWVAQWFLYSSRLHFCIM